MACAVRQPTLAGVITTIAGFHHEADDPVVQTPDCSDFVPPVTAKDLEMEQDPERKKELLEEFVKGTIEITSKIFADTAKKVLEETPPGDPRFRNKVRSESVASFRDKAPCFREPALRYGSIYAFIMDPVRGVAFLSGNDFTRNGLSVSLNDPDPPSYDGKGNIEPNVLTAIHRTLTETPPPDPIPTKLNRLTMTEGVDVEHGDSGFFTYHWAHPDPSLGLNTPDYLDRNEVPGRALKESYIEVANLYADLSPTLQLSVLFVFGSGIYHLEEEEDDNGCSIAATGSMPQNALLNLLLIASVLFSAVFLRKGG